MKTKYNLKRNLYRLVHSESKNTKHYINIDQHNLHPTLPTYQCHLLESNTLVPIMITITPTAIMLHKNHIEIKLARDVEYYITHKGIIFVTVSKKYIVAVSKRQCICIHKILLDL